MKQKSIIGALAAASLMASPALAQVRPVGDIENAEAELHKKQELLGEAGVPYVKCLFAHADVLAKNSQESADVLSVAILAACPTEKTNLEKAYLYINNTSYAGDFIHSFDMQVQPQIIFRVVAARAANPAPTLPSPARPGSNRDQL
jgi:hypothetical protein